MRWDADLSILCAAVAGPQATPIFLIAYNCLVDVYFLISSNITGGLLIKHGWRKERAWVGSARPERELKGGWGDKERRSGGIRHEEMTGESWHCQPPHIKAEPMSLNVTLSHCRKTQHYSHMKKGIWSLCLIFGCVLPLFMPTHWSEKSHVRRANI